MKVIDLSHPFNQDTELWPGTEPNKIIRKATVAKNGFLDHQYILSGHTATHIDSPAHFLENGRFLNDYPAEQFVGNGQVIDVSKGVQREITLDSPLRIEPDIDFVLFHTGWSDRWGSEAYYGDFSYLSHHLARELSTHDLKGVGIDSPSSDPINSEHFPAHHLLLGAGFILIENLCNLNVLINKRFIFSCLPLNIVGVEGSPVRAVALL